MKVKILLGVLFAFALMSFVSATNFNGFGSYTLLPQDEVTLTNGYVLKYINFQTDASWHRLQQLVTGDVADLGLYQGENQVYSFSVSDIDTEQTKTFSSGFYFYVEPLAKGSQEVKIKIEPGELSVCSDTDAGRHLTGDTWGLNYNEKGKANENVEGTSGQNQNKGEDVCLDNTKLKEYFCYNNRLKVTEYSCEGGCNNGACLSPVPELPNVRARAWITNQYDEEMTCRDLCKEFNSEVVVDGCYDRSLKTCTLMMGGVCIEGNANSIIKKDYSTSCCCKGGNFNECTSTDGVNPFVKGRTMDKSGNVYEDTCEGSKVIDYYCSNAGIYNLNDVLCPNGCENGACKKLEVEPTEETGPVEVPNKPDTETEFNSYVCSGCIMDKNCYSFGFRKSGKFCSDSNSQFIEQKQADSSCENNFECSSNVCVSSQCVSEGLLQKILNWFKRLFGAD
jgi:hypothetical protein